MVGMLWPSCHFYYVSVLSVLPISALTYFVLLRVWRVGWDVAVRWQHMFITQLAWGRATAAGGWDSAEDIRLRDWRARLAATAVLWMHETVAQLLHQARYDSLLAVKVHPSWVNQAPRVLSYCADALVWTINKRCVQDVCLTNFL